MNKVLLALSVCDCDVGNGWVCTFLWQHSHSMEQLGPIYTTRQRQRCDDANDVLIENNGAA